LSLGFALTTALALIILSDSVRPVQAAQVCTTLPSGQVYCLNKSDAIDPIRVGETQLFTIVESLSAGSTAVTDPGPLTDIVPSNYAITSAAATFVGAASGPPCIITGNTVTCPSPRTLGPGAGQVIVNITAVAITPGSKNSRCDGVINTAYSTIPGVTSNQVAEPTTILPEKGPQACGRKANDDPDDDDENADKKLTKEQKQNKSRSDNSNHDQRKTEGNVVGVRCKSSDAVPTLKRGFISKPDETPYALIGTADGVQQVVFTGGTKSKCKEIQVGDYLEAEGEKEHEQLFYADNDIDIRHR
jgi:hypothetical protein